MTEHAPVMAAQVTGLWCTDVRGVYVDCTFGRGGHARALLDRLAPDARLLVIDRDPDAVAAARDLAARDVRVTPVHGRFSELAAILERHDVAAVAGVLFDLGVSSPQLDDPGRGFSFQQDGPLDMRMDNTGGTTAEQWLNAAPVAEMTRVFRTYGEERFAGRISRAIEAARPVRSTRALARIVTAAQGGQTAGKHGATRVFQAIRIQINDELEEIKRGLAAAFEHLRPGGRLLAMSFHSLEDRIVKRSFNELVSPRQHPRRLPIRGVEDPLARKVAGPMRASAAEVAANPRARSATLRVIERTAPRRSGSDAAGRGSKVRGAGHAGSDLREGGS